MKRCKLPKYQTGLSAEDKMALEEYKSVLRQNAGEDNDIRQAEQLVLQSYQSPRQYFQDLPAIQSPQLKSILTPEMKYADTASQYVGSTVPMQLALTNLDKQKQDKIYAYSKGVQRPEVLDPDLQYINPIVEQTNKAISDITNKVANKELTTNEAYRAIGQLRNEYTNNLAIQKAVANKQYRDRVLAEIDKNDKLNADDKILAKASFDKRYAQELGIGTGNEYGAYNPYKTRNLEEDISTYKVDLVNKLVSGWNSGGQDVVRANAGTNGTYIFEKKVGNKWERISEDEVRKRIQPVLANDAKMKSYYNMQGYLKSPFMNPDKVKQNLYQQIDAEIQRIANNPKTTPQQLRQLTEQRKRIENLNVDDYLASSLMEEDVARLTNLGVDKTAYLKTGYTEDEGLKADPYGLQRGQWEREDRLERDNQVVPLQGTTGSEELPESLEGFGTKDPLLSKEGSEQFKLFMKSKGAKLNSSGTDYIDENGKVLPIYKYMDEFKSLSKNPINLADNLAKNDSMFKEIYDYQLRNGKGTAKERANEAYKVYRAEKMSSPFNKGIVFSQPQQAENFKTMVKAGNLSGTTKDGIPIMKWLDQQASRLNLKTKDGKAITTGIELVDNIDGVTVNPYTQELGINVRGVQLSVPATDNMKQEMKVLSDLKRSREEGKNIQTKMTLGNLQLNGNAVTTYNQGSPKTVFIPNPSNEYEKQVIDALQQKLPYFDLSKGIPIEVIDRMYQDSNTTLGFRGTPSQDNSGTEKLNIKKKQKLSFDDEGNVTGYSISD